MHKRLLNEKHAEVLQTMKCDVGCIASSHYEDEDVTVYEVRTWSPP